jgi:hypothetical protein
MAVNCQFSTRGLFFSRLSVAWKIPPPTIYILPWIRKCPVKLRLSFHSVP